MNNSAEQTNYRLLIVDDNRDIHNDIRKILTSSTSLSVLNDIEAELFDDMDIKGDPANTSFEIASAYQGEEAAILVRESVAEGRPFSVAFVDMRMPPGWDGLQTIEHIFQDDPNIQVVICSAYSDQDWCDIVERLGTNDRLLVLKKPFDNVEINQMAHALSHKWTLQQAARQQLNNLDALIKQRTQALEESHQQLKAEMIVRERVETELQLAQKLEAIGQMAAGIAHEINTPTQFVGDNTRFMQTSFNDITQLLNAYQQLVKKIQADPATDKAMTDIKAIIEDIDLDYLLDEVPNAIQQALDGVGRISNIVKAMKEFSHPGSAQKELVDINKAIANTITVSSNEWKYVAEIKTDFDPELPLVECLQGELNQTILNLIVNAAHAIADVIDNKQCEKGLITISTKKIEDKCQITISDTGSGIPAEIRSKIFDPFFTTKEVGKGTGQGLSIAYSVVVDKHQGSICVDSEPGAGTTFTILIPIKEPVDSTNAQTVNGDQK